MSRGLLTAAAVILAIVGLLAALLAIQATIGLVTLAGSSPGAGYGLLLPIAVIGGLITVGCAAGVFACAAQARRRQAPTVGEPN